MHRIFIDGQAGTTGLQIHEQLAGRSDIELLEISPQARKDVAAKKSLIESADVVVLCLPDDAARETVALDEQSRTRFIDASTAHRVNPAWVYGFPELSSEQRAAVGQARLVSNPGCYPTGFLAAVKPLIDAALLKPDALLSISAVSGYSGGGRALIEKYTAREEQGPTSRWPIRPYALGLQHKHVPEMTYYAGLQHSPIFLPAVGHFHQGMLVNVPVFKEQLTRPASIEEINELLKLRYQNEPCINVLPPNTEAVLDGGFLDPEGANGTNRVDLMTYGHEDQMLIIARLDNLGKGASGAAVQNLNLMLQLPELEGLNL